MWTSVLRPGDDLPLGGLCSRDGTYTVDLALRRLGEPIASWIIGVRGGEVTSPPVLRARHFSMTGVTGQRQCYVTVRRSGRVVGGFPVTLMP